MNSRHAVSACAVAIFLTCASVAVAQQPAAQRLTMKEAIALALKNNLGILAASTRVDEAQGTRERQLAMLLPHASGDILASRQNRNLQVAGISVPGIPVVVGPFSYNDFRVAVNQSLIDRQAYHSWKASQSQEQATKLDYQDARDLVVRQAAGLYLESQYAWAEVQAAESRVATSQTLEKLARDQHNAGLATGVDVLRAQVQLARDQQNLLTARNAFQTSLLDLARYLGRKPGAPLELAEQLQFQQIPLPDLDQSLQTALQARSDYRSLAAQRDALVEQEKASHARYWPKLAVSGDYGALGRNFGSMPGIGEIQGTLSVTIFDRDRGGERKQLESRLARLDHQIADYARGIEQELRKAALDLESAAEQVRVTEAALKLAEQELALAGDRFRSGVGDNIEVVTAQDALSAAQNDRIGALARHSDARMALARALGATEKNYEQYLPKP